MKIAVVFGTRPEVIKLARVVSAIAKHPALEVEVCVTGQHREMLNQALEVFGLKPEVDLDLMQQNQTLSSLTARTVERVQLFLAESRPDMVIVQGDTTTTFSAALAAFYEKIPVAHVEAGLRTGDRWAPYPEEMNRILTSRLADLHFAPTQGSADNLLREGISPDRIWVTGNTVIDALLYAVEKVRAEKPAIPQLDEALLASDARIVLITGHRRENFGSGFENICSAIRSLARRFPRVEFVYPVHLNPNVRKPVFRELGSLHNVHLIDPVGYLQFVWLMDRAALILTDSGGVQEEAPSLGKPVLVMRNTTERPEGVNAGIVRLVGTAPDTIIQSVAQLLREDAEQVAVTRGRSPYGDGAASKQIVEICERFLTSKALRRDNLLG